jgi:VIT1/CCC1 family predicted Fe2+/Mn2+ transporter
VGKQHGDARVRDQGGRHAAAKDALAAHAQDELHIPHVTSARPIQAALTSAATFATGAMLPLLTVLLVPGGVITPAVAIASLVFLALLGAVGARAGGARMIRAIVRVSFWGALAMALTGQRHRLRLRRPSLEPGSRAGTAPDG